MTTCEYCFSTIVLARNLPRHQQNSKCKKIQEEIKKAKEEALELENKINKKLKEQVKEKVNDKIEVYEEQVEKRIKELERIIYDLNKKNDIFRKTIINGIEKMIYDNNVKIYKTIETTFNKTINAFNHKIDTELVSTIKDTLINVLNGRHICDSDIKDKKENKMEDKDKKIIKTPIQKTPIKPLTTIGQYKPIKMEYKSVPVNNKVGLDDESGDDETDDDTGNDTETESITGDGNETSEEVDEE